MVKRRGGVPGADQGGVGREAKPTRDLGHQDHQRVNHSRVPLGTQEVTKQARGEVEG